MADERERYPLPWRVGSKGKQTIYDASPEGDGGLPGRSLGRMDKPQLAAFVVEAVNGLAAAREENERLREALENLARNDSDGRCWCGVRQAPPHTLTCQRVRAALAREDGGPTIAREDELAKLRGLLLQASTALLSAMAGGPVDDSVLNDIEAALPQGLARENGGNG